MEEPARPHIHIEGAEVSPAGMLTVTLAQSYARALVGSHFDRKRGVDIVPEGQISETMARLRAEGFAVRFQCDYPPMPLATWRERASCRLRISRVDTAIADSVGERLYGYQKSGAAWLSQGRRRLLADEPGLGKTRQVLVALLANASALVLCPAGAKDVWVREAKRCRPQLRAFAVHGKAAFRMPKPGALVIANHELVPPVHVASCTSATCRGCAPWLRSIALGTVIVYDEAQLIKGDSERARRARALTLRVLERDGFVWGSTGTPLEAGPKDLWNVLYALDLHAEAFGSWEHYVELWNARSKVASYGSTYAWGVPDGEIVRGLSRVALRRLTEDVQPDLPPVTFEDVRVSLDKKTIALCDAYVDVAGGLDALREKLTAKTLSLGQMATVREAIATATVPAAVRLIERLESARRGPLVVFSDHRRPLDVLAGRAGWSAITGDTTKKGERQHIVEMFQTGRLRGLACSIRAAGTAITLTRSNLALFIDEAWNSTANEQARKRIHRIGQQRSCHYIRFVADHPLVERLQELNARKANQIAVSVDASSVRILRENASMSMGTRTGPANPVRQEIVATLQSLECPPEMEAELSKLVAEVTRCGLTEEGWKFAKQFVRGYGSQKPLAHSTERDYEHTS